MEVIQDSDFSLPASRQAPCGSKSGSVPARMLLSLIESKAEIGTWSFDGPTGAITLSSYARVMFELDPILGIPSLGAALKLVHASDRETVLSAIGMLRSGINQKFEFRLLGEQNQIRWISVEAAASLTPKGMLECVFGFAQDVTTMRRCSMAVEDNGRRARQVAEAHGLKTWISANPIVADPQQLAPAITNAENEMVDRIHPDDLSNVEDILLRARVESKPVVVHAKFLTTNDKCLPTKVYVTPIKDRWGHLVEWHVASMQAPQIDLEPLPLASIEGRHLRAARGMLGWALGELAARSKVSMSTIRRAEENGLIAIGSRSGNTIRNALSSAGVSISKIGDARIAVIETGRA